MSRVEPVPQRIARYSKREGDCTVWTGSTSNGYGRICIRGKTLKAHRVAYELEHGPIKDGLYLDHLCRNRACINPAHLEPVTLRENTLRGVSFSAENARKVLCKHGHPLSGDGVRVRRTKNGLGRVCKACARTTSREHMARKRAALRKAKGVAA